MNTHPNPRIRPLATDRLVGEDRFVAQVQAAAYANDQSRPRALFLIQAGGFGKTRRLQLALQEPARMFGPTGVLVAGDLLDFYNVRLHDPIGLVDALHTALIAGGASEGTFKAFQDRLHELEREKSISHPKKLSDLRKETLNAFVAAMQALSADQTVVVALDTAERIVYERDGRVSTSESWIWLRDSLSAWGNVVVLIAGRPRAQRLNEQLQVKLGTNVGNIEIEPLTESDSLEYFDLLEAQLRSGSRTEWANRLKKLSGEQRRVAAWCGNRTPILLSLLVDNLAFSDDPLPVLARAYDDLQALSEEEKAKLRRETEGRLVRNLIDPANGIGDVLLALGRARRGLDPALLMKLEECTRRQAERWLDDVRPFSFIKAYVDPRGRLFLHDEMYALLDRHVFASESDARSKRKALAILREEYDQTLDDCNQRINELFEPVERGDALHIFDRPAFDRLRAERTQIITDAIFYRLREDSLAGFQYYYRTVREAALANDRALDIQVQAEVQAYLDHLRDTGQAADPDLLAQYQGIQPLREIVRLYADGNYTQAADVARVLIDELGPQVEQDPKQIPTLAVAQAWWVNAVTDAGNPERFPEALRMIDEAIGQIESFIRSRQRDGLNAAMQTGDDATLWRAQAVQAFASWVRGHLKRSIGQMEAAVADYGRSASLWRRLGFDREFARTRNSMGFAMSENGDWVGGRKAIQEAITIRRRMGIPNQVASSLNSYGLVEMSAGNFDAAISSSERARRLFTALEDNYGRGLALMALSEAYRRDATHRVSAEPVAVKDIVSRLRAAREYGEDAITIYGEKGLQPSRHLEVKARIELGCALRDLVRVFRRYPAEANRPIRQLARESCDQLQTAANLAGDALLYRKADALVNLAWLAFYAGDENMSPDSTFENAVKRADASIPETYHLISTILGRDKDALPTLYAQLGKLRILQGHRILDSNDIKRFDEAIHHYAEGLQYSSLYSDQSVGQMQSKDQIIERIVKLKPRDWRRMVDIVRNFENEVNLPEGQSVLGRLLRDNAFDAS